MEPLTGKNLVPSSHSAPGSSNGNGGKECKLSNTNGNGSDSDYEDQLMCMKISINGQRVRKASFRLPCPEATGRNIRAHLANFREQVRAEDNRLQQGCENHKDSKLVAGGWALAPEQMDFLKDRDYEYNASAGSILELFVMQK